MNHSYRALPERRALLQDCQTRYLSSSATCMGPTSFAEMQSLDADASRVLYATGCILCPANRLRAYKLQALQVVLVLVCKAGRSGANEAYTGVDSCNHLLSLVCRSSCTTELDWGGHRTNLMLMPLLRCVHFALCFTRVGFRNFTLF